MMLAALMVRIQFDDVCDWFGAGVVREACRERGQIRLTFTAGTGEEIRPLQEDK